MSDFDKEAEREKLREKYEQDKQKREATEKMSELLLQGATMTNAHCSECGDPIFRYDGQEFCATCERPVDREGTGDETDGSDEQEESVPESIEVTSPSDDVRVAFGGAAPDETEGDGSRSQERTNVEGRPSAGTGEAAPGRQSGPSHSQPSGSETGVERGERAATRDSGNVSAARGDVSAARASLVRTLTRFSEQADACEDPQRAREYLAAAREAAETLDALGR